jgi:long-chain acyl-CoA synthetase
MQQSEIIAKYLLKLGICTADKVGIFSANHPEWTISDLSILSLRAVVVPIYSTATYEQLEYIINETKMSVLFVDNEEQLKLAIKVQEKGEYLRWIITFNCAEHTDESIVRFKDILTQNFDDNDDVLLKKQLSDGTPYDLATIIYTSGTTGEPKGVMLDHNNFMFSFEIHAKRLDLSEKDVSLCFLPLSHIFERAWTYFVLYSGAINVYNVDPKEIISVLPQVKPTVMCVVPRFFEKTYEGILDQVDQWTSLKRKVFKWAIHVGLQYIDFQKDNRKAPTKLRWQHQLANRLVHEKVRAVFGGKIRYMPCSGSAMSIELRRFFHALGVFVNYGYGATETLATVSCMRHDKYDFENTGSIMPEVKVKISDEGMILVKGETVFKGYYKKPEETNEVLKDGWYYTGDMGSLPKPGVLLMTERMKDIMKTSTGKFISPQKIELLLSKSEFVEQVCVIGDNRKYLVALIVPVINQLNRWVENKGTGKVDPFTLNEDTELISMLQNHFEQLQKSLPKHEHIIRFHLLPEPFSISNSMLTNSMKVRRKQVNLHYNKEIDALYS